MSRSDQQPPERGGPIAYMATNRVAANLCMFGILAAGVVSFGALERQAWPTVPFNTVEVSVAYPGATPEEVKESIVVKIEEQVRRIEHNLPKVLELTKHQQRVLLRSTQNQS